MSSCEDRILVGRYGRPPAMAAERRDIGKAKYVLKTRLCMTRRFGSNLI